MSQVVLIGIIDSGVLNAQQSLVTEHGGFYWQQKQKKVIVKAATEDCLGHGSAIAEVISTQAPNVSLLIAQVFHQQYVTTPAQVAAALDWLVKQGAKVINMSFGLRFDRQILREACERAIEQGVILVGSSPARGEPVYPSAYSRVVRATGDGRCAANELSVLYSQLADFGACVRNTSSNSSLSGSSVAAAFLTGHIARYLTEGGDSQLEALNLWLFEQAKYKITDRKLL
jgi:subtilisin family serine protease